MTATKIAQFNTQQQAAFVHQVRAPYVHAAYPAQRLFCSKPPLVTDYVDCDKDTRWQSVYTEVWRIAHEDYAQVKTAVDTTAGKSSITALLNAAELRSLAARLIDAAADIEANPADTLERMAHAQKAAA